MFNDILFQILIRAAVFVLFFAFLMYFIYGVSLVFSDYALQLLNRKEKAGNNA